MVQNGPTRGAVGDRSQRLIAVRVTQVQEVTVAPRITAVKDS